MIAGALLCATLVWATVGFLLMGIGLLSLLVAENNRKRASRPVVRRARVEQALFEKALNPFLSDERRAEVVNVAMSVLVRANRVGQARAASSFPFPVLCVCGVCMCVVCAVRRAKRCVVC